jgi:hypothetical protein
MSEIKEMSGFEKVEELLAVTQPIPDRDETNEEFHWKKYYWNIHQVNVNIYCRVMMNIVVYNHFQDRLFEKTILLDKNLPSYDGDTMETATDKIYDAFYDECLPNLGESQEDWENR